MSETIKTETAPPEASTEQEPFIAKPLSAAQRDEKELLEVLAQSQWLLLGALRKSVAPHLLAEAYCRGLLLSDPLWEEATSNALYDFDCAREQVVALYNSQITGEANDEDSQNRQ